MMDHITVKGQGGTFDAYIARPKILPASAVVVLQELFGVNADIRKHCDELAEQGYLWSHQDYGRLEGIRSGVRICRWSRLCGSMGGECGIRARS
jgi:Dienelactone hydrolase family